MHEYVQKHDLMLIPHELKEMGYVISEHMSYEDAHEKVCEDPELDYQTASTEFYNALKRQVKPRLTKDFYKKHFLGKGRP